MLRLVDNKPYIRVSPPGPEAIKVLKKDARYISPSYTRAYPLVAQRGEGMMIEDPDGNRYLDLNAGVAVCTTGHCHPDIVRAIEEQSKTLIHMIGTDFYYRWQADAAQVLTEITPGKFAKKVFLANTGAEAVESGIKLARYAQRRPRMIAYIGCFHGRTMGALSLTASKAVQRRHFSPLLADVTHIPYPYCYRCIFNLSYPKCNFACLSYLEDVIFTKVAPPEDVSAIIVEPIQGEGGYIVPPDGYFQALKKITDKYGILLIVDEIQSGMGRTGKMFAIEYWKIEPDIICLGKGAASGMPFSAMVARAGLHKWPAGAHANTFGGNPVCCAAALKTIELLQESLVENARVCGNYLLKCLKNLQNKYDFIGDVRGKGLMVGVEIVKNRKTKTKDPERRNSIVQNAFKKGLLILGCGENTIRFCPPLIITKDDIDITMEIFGKVLRAR
ncbi:MAG: acetyl ornithine aminotransferase family protein [Planctomycetota bacterium]|nr:acetyl ornithine aminotransferase family protein [Planctomycetota bacterium]MDI6786877.1 acetyl ornithine aminotransferase family protein [Planctomycetota bacterium]